MCFSSPTPSAAAPVLASTTSGEANRAADVEALLRRRRAGAAANVVTSPLGIPGTKQLGAPA